MDVVAAKRDASWFGHPDVYSLKKYHIAINTGDLRRQLVLGIAPAYVAACNPETRPLFELTAMAADRVPEGLRCQSNGCRQRWP